jgi:hypothetical protein
MKYKRKTKVPVRMLQGRGEDFEDWHREEYEEDPDNAPRTFKKLPHKYETGFLARLDGRKPTTKILHRAYSQITDDLGGEETLSTVQKVLIEKFCFLSFVLRSLERQIAENPKDSTLLIGRWTQGLNTLQGLGKTIGLHRQHRAITLKSYVRSQADG